MDIGRCTKVKSRSNRGVDGGCTPPLCPRGKCPGANALKAHGRHDVSSRSSETPVLELGGPSKSERSPDEDGKRDCIALLHSDLCYDEFQLSSDKGPAASLGD